MAIDFGRSARSSLGIEWELALVDRTTGDLAPVAPDVLASLDLEDDSGFSRITAELLTNTVEVVSGVHETVGAAVGDLQRTIDAVRTAAEPLGVAPMCAGTHPFAEWSRQRITDKERYATLIDRTQWWGRQMLVWGVHMHVGIEDRDKLFPILQAMLAYYPHLQALSASSPFWAGEATGYASNRAMMFQQLPTAGLPPALDDWSAYEGVVDDLLRVGVIDQYDELRWDLRPSPKWGTLEIRICDGLSTADEVAALAALVQCLVEDLSSRLDAGETLPAMPVWYVKENKWRAARYGMETILIRDAAGEERHVAEEVRDLVARLEPVADRLGCSDELASVTRILDAGAGYERQLCTAARSGGSLKAVVAGLVAELRDGLGAVS